MIGTSTIAAPRATYANVAGARPVMTATPSYVAPQARAASYVAPPVMTASYAAPAMPQPVAMQQPAAPQPPRSLTAGIPTPEQIQTQKAQFAAALDKQLQEAVETVRKETEIEKQMVKFNTEKQISLYNMQVDEKLAELTAAAAESSTISDLELKKALVERTLQLNSQAQSLAFDYNMKATQQELLERKTAFEKQYLNEEAKLAQQYASTLQQAGPAAMPMNASPSPVATYAAASPAATYAAPRPVTYAAAPRTVAYPSATPATTVRVGAVA